MIRWPWRRRRYCKPLEQSDSAARHAGVTRMTVRAWRQYDQAVETALRVARGGRSA